MSHFLVSLGWALLFAATLMVIAGWELEALIAALLAGVAFVVAAWKEKRNGTVAR